MRIITNFMSFYRNYICSHKNHQYYLKQIHILQEINETTYTSILLLVVIQNPCHSLTLVNIASINQQVSLKFAALVFFWRCIFCKSILLWPKLKPIPITIQITTQETLFLSCLFCSQDFRNKSFTTFTILPRFIFYKEHCQLLDQGYSHVRTRTRYLSVQWLNDGTINETMRRLILQQEIELPTRTYKYTSCSDITVNTYCPFPT
eukprot:TRINITY_DN30172_c0_g1_i1.p1 TRINITY_DN30172_c0_g1~~TRINITY_DN30172_c0_g1_i1.p1  ORF type:complete len:205 (-),score=-29.99 TRINITY_DN30172_c0_g1_i1:42-656(-)